MLKYYIFSKILCSHALIVPSRDILCIIQDGNICKKVEIADQLVILQFMKPKARTKAYVRGKLG